MKKFLCLCTLCFLFPLSCFASTNTTFKENINEDFTEINIRLNSENLFIHEITSPEFIVELISNDKKNQPKVFWDDETLEIQAKKFKYSIGYRCEVHVYIPQNYVFEEIRLTSTSGDIEIDSISTDEITCTLTSGNLSVKNLISNQCKLTLTSGDVKIDTVSSERNVIANSTSGNLYFKNLFTNTSKLTTTSGSIDVEKFDGEALYGTSTSGSCFFGDSLCDSFNLRSTSGNISIDLYDCPLATSSIETTSGVAKIYISSSADFDLNFKTNSGVFTDDRGNKKMRINGNCEQSFNNGGVIIDVQTTSGNLYILE